MTGESGHVEYYGEARDPRVYYPDPSILLSDMSAVDRVAHLTSILQIPNDAEALGQYFERTMRSKETRLVMDVIQQFYANCRRNGDPVVFDKTDASTVLYVPERRIHEINDAEDPFSFFITPERRGVALGKVLRSGVILLASDPNTTLAVVHR